MNETAGYSRAATPAADGARGKKADPGLEEKPFRLVKSFSVAAIGLIFATALTLAAVVSRQAEKIISNRVEDDTIKLMENLNNQMFYGFLIPARPENRLFFSPLPELGEMTEPDPEARP
ncbi:MAG: hypothetical protein LBV21_02095, partial [Candidatus Adiutrix sp.]|nr:hypothetical protein [Candidatus Adiutrix sp.]